MKHSSVLMLGLATLALSSASAYASEPLNFDPISSERSATYMPASIATNLPRQSLPNPVDAEKRMISRSDSRSEPSKTSDLPNLPLFELPPFQSDSSSSLPLQDRDKLYPADRYAVSKPLTSEASNQSSPFAFPDELTDADLFESDSAQMNEPNSSNSDLPGSNSASDSLPGLMPDSMSSSMSSSIPQDNPEIEVKKTPDVTTESLNGWFKSSDPNTAENRRTSESNGENIPFLASAKSDASDLIAKNEAIGLDFDPPAQSYDSSLVSESVIVSDSIASLPKSQSNIISGDNTSLDQLFKGNSDSLVAVAVGSAEGTRSADGGKNPAYQGHTDPGNGVWNLGSFSYQHGASSPEEADAKQLARLRSQAQTILDMAATKGLDLTLEEKLNGIDLANQAPKAALDEYGGYIDWLAVARTSGLDGADAILSARVRSFLDPQTKTWDAPGLGNSEERITSDQERRMLAIARAIATYVQDIADRRSSHQSTNQFTQPVSRQVPTETQATAQLFTQKVIRLFGNSANVSQAEVSEPELPVVAQILALDLSDLRAA